MELYLIRHTRVAVPKGTLYGQSDVALADTFAEEAATIRAQLPAAWDLLYSSPLTRCKTLADWLDPAPDFDDLLMEMSFGDWDGKLLTDLPQKEARDWGDNWLTQRTPGGEGFPDLYQRSEQFVERLVREAKGKVALVVAHSGLLRCLCLQLHPEYCRWDKSKTFSIPLDYGGVIHIPAPNLPEG
ncbi:alpha-ribazole phosphatase [Hahella aquimaris]|uniref:alpha-ribazole phosphatase n=1 Tax=Hahella sp. HNIBRBA332 TaxID=3015983 RepID=UPI00273B973A|nr:alpha-ribazole phosphatase [Hahella sp. HNIBRBA332]WLQ12284.1 alpha-ribazole phosphatase [Hahella sp. HNIBRBA332]